MLLRYFVTLTTRERLYRILLGREGGASLAELSRELGMAGPPILHHLRAMLADESIEKFTPPGSARPLYRLRPRVSIWWMDPASHRFEVWSSRRPISWHYPLVSRIPDERAQDAVLAFLRHAREKRLFLPPLEKRKGRANERSHGVRIIAYGSIMREEAGASSDVDLLALTGPASKAREALLDAAAEVNLDAPRRIDLRVFAEGSLTRLAPRYAATVERDGFVVYSSFEGGEYEPILLEDNDA